MGPSISAPVSLHDVDEVVRCGVAAQRDVSVVDLVLREDALHSLQVQLTLDALREGAAEHNSSSNTTLGKSSTSIAGSLVLEQVSSRTSANAVLKYL